MKQLFYCEIAQGYNAQVVRGGNVCARLHPVNVCEGIR